MITKKFLMTFLPYDYEGVEKMLSEKSSQGWQLVKTGNYAWTFTQGECNEFQYNVTYVPNASEYRAEDTDHQITLDEYCTNAGWERVCNYKKMQIYRNRDPLAVPIDTDESQKLQMLHQAIKKWMLLPSGLCSLFLILLAVGVIVKRNEPLTFPVVKSLFVLLVIAAYGIVEIMNYYVWYFQSKKSISMNGKCCSAKRADLIHTVSEFLLSIFIIGNIFFFDQITVFEVTFFTGISIFFLIHAAWIKRLCKYVGCPAVANRIITIVGSVILSFYCSVWVCAMLVARGFLPGF